MERRWSANTVQGMYPIVLLCELQETHSGKTAQRMLFALFSHRVHSNTTSSNDHHSSGRQSLESRYVVLSLPSLRIRLL